MTSTSPFARVCAAGNRAAALLVPLAPLLGRLAFGQAFFVTGLGKLQNLPKITAYFESLGIPFANLQAPMIGTLEMVGGIALMLGLFTRSFAFLLSCTMVVAILTAEGSNLLAALPFRDSLFDVKPLPFLAALVWLIAGGAGPISTDRLVARKGSASSTPSM